MIVVSNEILSLPLDLKCNDSPIRIAISLATFIYPDAVNANDKLLKQQLFEAL